MPTRRSRGAIKFKVSEGVDLVHSHGEGDEGVASRDGDLWVAIGEGEGKVVVVVGGGVFNDDLGMLECGMSIIK